MIEENVKLLESRMKQSQPDEDKRMQRQQVLGYLPSVFKTTSNHSAYHKYMSKLESQKGFGHDQDQQKLRFKSSHLSSVQAVVAKRDLLAQRL